MAKAGVFGRSDDFRGRFGPGGVCLRAASHTVRFLSHVANAVIFAVLFAMMVVGLYALWDAGAVYTAASSSKWEAYVPAEEDHGTYDELVSINSDVVGWLDVYGTNIDYPLVQADDVKYLTHDAKGDYSLTGALFLDSRNADDFSDFSTIVYGHHLDSNVMFGEIGSFADADYFAAHEYGTLFIGRGQRENTLVGLHFIAFLEADAYDGAVYRAKVDGPAQQASYVEHLKGLASNVREVEVEPASGERIVLLSTCSSEAANARSILVAKIEEEIHENPFVEEANAGIGVDMPEGWFSFPWIGWAALAALFALAFGLLLSRMGRRRRARRDKASTLRGGAGVAAHGRKR